MHKKLLIEVFKKIKEIEKESTGIEPSTTAAAKLISEFISENKKIPFGPKSLTDYHRDAENEKEGEKEVTIKQPKVVEAMCEILGFDNFVEFQKVHASKPPLNPFLSITQFYKQNKTLIIVSFIVIIITSVIFSVNQQRWMIWENDHYIEAPFDSEKLSSGVLKLYKKERIQSFKKIIPDCSTKFFKENGSPNLWYGKNTKGGLEYFTSFGLHPETGKTLKAITRYMIDKYICDTY